MGTFFLIPRSHSLFDFWLLSPPPTGLLLSQCCSSGLSPCLLPPYFPGNRANRSFNTGTKASIFADEMISIFPLMEKNSICRRRHRVCVSRGCLPFGGRRSAAKKTFTFPISILPVLSAPFWLIFRLGLVKRPPPPSRKERWI